jgi:hypothetical protein
VIWRALPVNCQGFDLARLISTLFWPTHRRSRNGDREKKRAHGGEIEKKERKKAAAGLLTLAQDVVIDGGGGR